MRKSLPVAPVQRFVGCRLRVEELPHAKDQRQRVGRDPLVAFVVFIVRVVTFLGVRFEIEKRGQCFETTWRANDMNRVIRYRNLRRPCARFDDEP
jgi:hypothetical protein